MYSNEFLGSIVLPSVAVGAGRRVDLALWLCSVSKMTSYAEVR